MLTSIKKSCFIASLLVCVFFTLSACSSNSDEKVIGIIVPLEHKAMDDIVTGFKEQLQQSSPIPLQFKVMNAQGDLTIQRSIIDQMKNQRVSLIVPIGSGPTNMAIAAIKQQPIVSLAASVTQQERSALKNCYLAVVHDEISPQQTLTFVHRTLPVLKQLVLIHSASDKVFPQVKEAVNAGKQLGITIKPMMITALNELYTLSKSLPANTQGIFVLKDSLIVSGTPTLAKLAAERKIPLITSDQGSVKEGAGFAIGVHEKQIGEEGAKLAAQVLAGKNPCELPIVTMTQLTLFVNEMQLMKESLSLAQIKKTAQSFHYTIELE